MTRFLAEQLSTTHWYDMAPATRDFGYVPKVTIAEGLRALQAALRSPARRARADGQPGSPVETPG